jgi:starch phosphorylase
MTNGIHVPTWLAPELSQLYEVYLGPDWMGNHDDPRLWERILSVPDDELWAVHRRLKWKLVGAMLERAQKRWRHGEATTEQLATMGTLLDSGVLTIGFARRFAGYKRAPLILEDVERLTRIIDNPGRPVQIIFAGKAHPADFEAKYLLHKVHTLAKEHRFQGRIAFVEDYDMHFARYLTQGVDVWLNTPIRLQEASGTSGMKAALNGVVHLSVPSGWWYEGANGSNGWAIGGKSDPWGLRDEDKSDAEEIYRILEEEVVPLYYDRDRCGVPHGWVRLIKDTISSIAPAFSARRMLKEYVDKMYLPSANSIAPKVP